MKKVFEGKGGAEGNGGGYAEKREKGRGGKRQHMSEKDGGAPQASGASCENVWLVVRANQKIPDVTVEPRKNDYGNREKHRRPQMNGEHGNYGGGQGQQQTVERGSRSFEKPTAKRKSY